MSDDQKQKNSMLFLAYTLLATMLVNSLYLSYKYINFYFLGGMMQGFDCVEDCDAVMMSAYSMLFGIPVPVYGLAFFIALSLMFYFLKYSLVKILFEFSLLVGCLAASGFLFILYFKLHMMCKFCLLSHVCLFLFTGLYFSAIRKTIRASAIL